jgi:integrase
MSVLSNLEQLGLYKTEIDLIPAFREFLARHPNPLGQALLDDDQSELWEASDTKCFEDLVFRFGGSEKQMAAFLAIAHHAAHNWSVTYGKRVTLPRFSAPDRSDPSAASAGLASQAARYHRWRQQLDSWIEGLFDSNTANISNRPLLLSAFIVSSMLHGGAYGARLIAGVIRAIASHRERSFILNGRVHLELLLSWGYIADGERHIWLPDTLSACLWTWLEPEDAVGLLEPVSRLQGMRPPRDGEIFRRVTKLIRSFCETSSRTELGTLFDLRRCCWVMANTNLNPIMARYCDGHISSNSPIRKHLRRLFPKGEFIEFGNPETATLAEPEGELKRKSSPSGADLIEAGTVPSSPSREPRAWIVEVCQAAESKDPKKSLAKIAGRGEPVALLAGFGISLLSSTQYSGGRATRTEIACVLEFVGMSLGAEMEAQDIAQIETEEALEIYVRAIEQQPIGERRRLIKWVLELDLYIRARVKSRDPIPLSRLPWPPEDGSFETGFVTHEEFEEILLRIDEFWNGKDSARRRKMIHLIVVIAFRIGLRTSEIEQLRLSDLLVRGSPEILLMPWPKERFKTKSAHRRIPLEGLLLDFELADFINWRQTRLDQDAKPSDRLFAIPEENLNEIHKWFWDDLNDFLRAHSSTGLDDGYIHMHTFRHAFQCWAFTAMIMIEGQISLSPFPDLQLTSQWVAQQSSKTWHGHNRPTAKQAYMLASLAGHSTFFTTAQSYVHVFPWLVQSLFDVSPVMQPSDYLVGLASWSPESTQRTWRKRRINVAVKLLKHRYKGVHVEIPEADQSPLGERPVVSSLEATWNLLYRQARTNSAIEPESTTQRLIDRAQKVADLTHSSGAYRHPMEIGEKGKRLACPVRPRRTAEVCDSNVWKRLQKLPPEEIFDGVRIFIDRAEKDGWVRFDSLADADLAKLYIRFLFLAGFDRNKQVVASSGESEEWKRRLDYYGTDLLWTSGLSATEPGLLIRPHLSAIEGTYAGFCFALVMAYIKFGFGEI